MPVYGKRKLAALAMVCVVAAGCDDDDITNPFEDVEEPRIAFASNRDGDFEIWTMDSDGTTPLQLTNDNFVDNNPSWRGDGDYITFVSTRTNGTTGDIWIMEADGSDQANVTNNAANDDHPSFSPDGDQILFTSNRDGDYDIYVIDTDGTDLLQLTNIAGDDTWPAWSPDGDQIVFTSTRAGSVGADILGDERRRQRARSAHHRSRDRPAAVVVSRWKQDRVLDDTRHEH